MPARQRHFLALQPDASARAALVALAATSLPDGAHRVAAEDLHLTLAFLGTLDAAGEARALAATQALTAHAIDVRLDTLEWWPGPRILCAAARPGTDSVAAAAGVLESELVARGFAAAGRPFRSHVTLARKLGRGVADGAPETVSPQVRWEARSVALMASRGAVRPRYETVATVALGGGEVHFSTTSPD